MKVLALIPLCIVAYLFQDAPQDQAVATGRPAETASQAAPQQAEKPPVDMKAVDVEPKPGQEGTVWVKVWVTAKGEPKDVEVLKSENPVFNQAALDAAKEYRFTPAEIKGKPVAVWVTIPFKFKLADKKEATTK